MARPQEFNRIEALNAATNLFWRQGYGATSVAQLLDEMALSRSSLYSAFGDKRALYVEVLNHFGVMTEQLFAPLKAIDDPQDFVRTYFELAFSSNIKLQRQGCLMVNAILEQAGVDEPLAKLAVKKLQGVEQLLSAGFRRAKDLGKLSPQYSPESLAKLMMTLTQGLRVAARVVDRQQLNDVIETMTGLLKPVIDIDTK